jgi:hypothetical protein
VVFEREVKVTIEHGHGNHLCNEMSSTAYWYGEKPTAAKKPPAVKKRLPVRRDSLGAWLYEKSNQTTSRVVEPNAEMQEMKRRWREQHGD